MSVLNERLPQSKSVMVSSGPSAVSVSSTRQIRIVAVDDNPGYLEILEVIMSSADDIQWLGGYTDPNLFLRDVGKIDPDVVLMDTRMPHQDGIWALNELRRMGNKVCVLMLSVINDNDTILTALGSGAQGYVLKSSAGDQLVWAVRDAANGGSPISSSIARRILEEFIEKGAPKKIEKRKPKDPMMELTKRERQLMEHLASGKKYVEIGVALGITVDTVGTHVRNIYHKLNVRNRTEAAMLYYGSQRKQLADV